MADYKAGMPVGRLGKLSAAQKVHAFQAGRKLATEGVVFVEAVRCGSAFWVHFADGRRVHSDGIEARAFGTLRALAQKFWAEDEIWERGVA